MDEYPESVLAITLLPEEVAIRCFYLLSSPRDGMHVACGPDGEGKGSSEFVSSRNVLQSDERSNENDSPTTLAPLMWSGGDMHRYEVSEKCSLRGRAHRRRYEDDALGQRHSEL